MNTLKEHRGQPIAQTEIEDSSTRDKVHRLPPLLLPVLELLFVGLL